MLLISEMEHLGQDHIILEVTQLPIYTVGFGSDIDDTILKDVANATGGEYFYAPNASVLQSIFVGIAGTIVNFTAPDAKLNAAVANNVSFNDSKYINATYIPNSSIITYYYCNNDACTDVTYPNYLTGSEAEPYITYQGNRTILTWKVGNLPDYVLTLGTNWTVQYKLQINGSGGPLPVLMDTNVTYLGKDYVEPPKETYVTIEGNATGGTTSNPAINITLFAIPQYDNPPPRIKEVTAYHITQNDTRLEDTKIVWFNSTTSVTIVPVQNPRGTIILE